MSELEKMGIGELLSAYKMAILMAPQHGGSLLNGGLARMEEEHKYKMELVRRLKVYDESIKPIPCFMIPVGYDTYSEDCNGKLEEVQFPKSYVCIVHENKKDCKGE